MDSDTHSIYSRYKLVTEAFNVGPGGGGNGRLSMSQLKQVEPGHFLHPYVADKFTQMKQDAASQGVNLNINNAYRSYEKQVEMANRLGLYSRGGGEAEFLAGDRMAETEKTGVESEAAGGIGLGPIFFIAHDRATGVGQLDADLVAAPGFQSEFHEGSLVS